MFEVTGLFGSRRYCCRRSRSSPRCQSANLLLPLPLGDVVGNDGLRVLFLLLGILLLGPRRLLIGRPLVRLRLVAVRQDG
eukprot:9259261-Pyramimonas_sp.AAC.1